MGDGAEDRLGWEHPEVFGDGRKRRYYARPLAGQAPQRNARKRNHMSEINPKNFDQASVVVVGRAGGPFEIKEFNNGGSQAQLSIAVSKGYKDKNNNDAWVDTGTDWYTLTATKAYAEANWPDVAKGDKVRVDDARLEFKPYLKNTGEAGVEATLRFGTLVIVEAKSARVVGTANTEAKPF